MVGVCLILILTMDMGYWVESVKVIVIYLENLLVYTWKAFGLIFEKTYHVDRIRKIYSYLNYTALSTIIVVRFEIFIQQTCCWVSDSLLITTQVRKGNVEGEDEEEACGSLSIHVTFWFWCTHWKMLYVKNDVPRICNDCCWYCVMDFMTFRIFNEMGIIFHPSTVRSEWVDK